MWEALASEHRAWDLLEAVTTGRIEVGRLYDLWTETKQNPIEVRRLLDDGDIEPLIKPFLKVHGKKIKADSLAHIEVHLRALLPEGKKTPRSQVTTDWLTGQLYAYDGKRNTLRKVHSSWSVFFQYLTTVKGLFAVNPLDAVERPTVELSPTRFYELPDVQRIIADQPTAQRRLLLSLSYGAAIEITVLLGLTNSDIDKETREVRAAGTKAHRRDRMCRIADWAWPQVESYIDMMMPNVSLFSGLNRWTVSDWHRETVKRLKLRRYPLHCARDHWAVRAARAGTPIAVIQNQLGHSSPMLTLTKYGKFLPSASDRAKWEKAATAYEKKRAAK